MSETLNQEVAETVESTPVTEEQVVVVESTEPVAEVPAVEPEVTQ